MPRPLLTRRRRHPVAVGVAATLALSLAAAGCSTGRAPAPLDAPEPATAANSERVELRGAPPSAIDAPPAATIVEEDLADAEPPPPVDGTPDPALPFAPPSPLASLTAQTAPNVAAATHMVEAGRVHLVGGDSGAALEQFERAIAIDPANPYAYYFLAVLHFDNRTYDQSIAFADRAAALSQPHQPEWASRAYTLQGNAYEAAGRFADARRAYARALTAAPRNLAAMVGLARVGGATTGTP
ncbi:MAG: tetratricopeptide repeat protein [Candidatus Binatia bacterium]